ncbi:MAG: cytochrome P450 [Microcella sp.]|uniref:cytochrome P450 n=1 Tax=Microcella sp. TaxID=1913979 RepID=UPI0024C712D0|nr:cytochrome P450 [Microcella sp.]UYN83422.1 MAG: cytochrome P450 [Microcella sp.]
MVITQADVGTDLDAERQARFPLGARLTIDDLSLAGREHRLDELREAEPVTWMPELGGWLVTSRDAAREVLNPTAPMTVEVEQNMVRNSLGPMMLTSDGESHDAQRRPFEAPFRNRDIEARYGERITALAHRLIDAIEGDAHEPWNLGTRFASPFAVLMAGELLGLSLDDTERIDGFYSDFAGAMEYTGDPEPMRRADAARGELTALLLDELAAARRTPTHSLTSQVAGDDSHGLSDDELAAQLRVVLFGAIETIQASVMNTLYLLAEHPDQEAAAMDDRTLLSGAQEEARRLIPPVSFIERWTAEPVTIGGVELPEHEFVGVSVLAANRDPAHFDDPLRFDITRPNASRSLSFSFGVHACLGLHLARAQTTGAITALWDRLGRLRVVDATEPEGFAFRKPAVMRVAAAGG